MRGAQRGPFEELEGGETESRALTPSIGLSPESDRPDEAANEDFLFHLYRGSELLQDNRAHEAKEELERALHLQPHDAKGQDLLAVVYFRLGLYPRAISIYERLRRSSPRDTALLLNLALCYLKTGQAALARRDLELLLSVNPTHSRAWGYLGLACERLGALSDAEHAFEQGGHGQMARRMAERRVSQAAPVPIPAHSSPSHEVRDIVAAAFEELDAGELSFELAAPASDTKDNAPDSWKPVELGQMVQTNPDGGPPIEISPSGGRRRTLTVGVQPPHAGAPPPQRPSSVPPSPVKALTRDSIVLFPSSGSVVIHPSGIALVNTAAETGFAARLEAVRASSNALTMKLLERQAKGKSTGESFGGTSSPVVQASGEGQLVLAPRHGRRLSSFALGDEDDMCFIREDVLLGFDGALIFENGRLATGEGEFVAVVQLRGRGAVLLEAIGDILTLEIQGQRSLSVRREVVLGWFGRLVPRALSPSEAPCGQRGLVSFVGEGRVLVASA